MRKHHNFLAITLVATLLTSVNANADQQLTLKIGDLYEGGVIFYLDETNQHGLIVALTDQSENIPWDDGFNEDVSIGVRGDGVGAGKMNTAIMLAIHADKIKRNAPLQVAAQSAGDYSVQKDGITKCNSTEPYPAVGVCYGDWYLPSKFELNLMQQNRAIIDSTAVAHGGTALSKSNKDYYWSSTEVLSDGKFVWILSGDGLFSSTVKFREDGKIRSIHSF